MIVKGWRGRRVALLARRPSTSGHPVSLRERGGEEESERVWFCCGGRQILYTATFVMTQPLIAVIHALCLRPFWNGAFS